MVRRWTLLSSLRNKKAVRNENNGHFDGSKRSLVFQIFPPKDWDKRYLGVGLDRRGRGGRATVVKAELSIASYKHIGKCLTQSDVY